MRKFLNWLYSHGAGIAYAFILSIVLAIAAVVMLMIVLLAHWWDSIR